MKQKLMMRIIPTIVLAAILLGCSSQEPDQEKTTDAAAGLLDLESFLTNISDVSGDRYCKLTVKLVVSPQDAVSEINDDLLLKARIHDEVLRLLAAKSFEELKDPTGREAFREEMRVKLAALLPKGEVQQVLFAEFIVQ
jgi:flagellar basal body-associated protein FliL